MSYILGWLIPVLNRWGEAFCSHASAMLFQSVLVVAVVFALDRLLRKRVRAGVRYWIWMLVLIKLVLPLDLPSPISLAGWTVHYGSMVLAGVKHHGAGERGSSGRIVVAPPEFVDNRQTKVPGAAAGRTAAAVAATQPSPHEAGSAERSGDSSPLPTGTPVQEGSVSAALQSKQQSDSTPPPLSTRGLLFVIWGTVITILLGGLCVRLMFVRAMVNRATAAEDRIRWQLEAACRKVGILPRRVRIRISNEVSSPVICGILKPTVLLPTEFLDHLKNDYARTVFVHELTHLKRRDLHASLFQALLQVLWFYNPVVWVSSRVLRTLRELAVDESVVARLQQDPADYSETLVLVASLMPGTRSRMLGFVSVLESQSSLKQRIDHILSGAPSRSPGFRIAEAMLVLVCVVSLVPGSLALPTIWSRTNATVGHDVDVALMRKIVDSLEQAWRPDSEALRDADHLAASYELVSAQIGQRPEDLASYFARAVICERAFGFITGAFDTVGTGSTSNESIGPVMFHARVLLAKRALEDWNQVAKLSASDDRLNEYSRIARCTLAMSLAMLERGKAAREWLNYARQLSPDRTVASVSLGHILLQPRFESTAGYYADKSEILEIIGKTKEALANAVFAHRLEPNTSLYAWRVLDLYRRCRPCEPAELEARCAEMLRVWDNQPKPPTDVVALFGVQSRTQPPYPSAVVALIARLEREFWEERAPLSVWEQLRRGHQIEDRVLKNVIESAPEARRRIIDAWLADPSGVGHSSSQEDVVHNHDYTEAP